MKKLILICMLVLGACLFAGCAQSKAAVEKEENAYRVYYCTQDRMALEGVSESLDKAEPEKMAETMLQMMRIPPVGTVLKAAIPDNVTWSEISYEQDSQLYVYFDTTYSDQDPAAEVLCRAAVVKTLTEIEGVDYVGFYVNGQPLMDSFQNPVNLMTADSFVESSMDQVQEQTLILYFANEDGTGLVETKKHVASSSEVSAEELVLTQLIEGGDGVNSFAVLPEDLVIRSVTVKKGTCYVNLGSQFTDSIYETVEIVPIYAIVNSLTELSNINKVQILVDGNSDLNFRETISLNQSFDRKLEYVVNLGNAVVWEEHDN